MANLDYQYITSLVINAQNGSSDAFAELYAATCQKQYQFACAYLGDEYLAQEALQETYIQALTQIHSLLDPKLFLSQLSQIEYLVCYKMLKKENSESINIEGTTYSLHRIMNLPFTESQVIMMKYCDHMTNKEIAKLLDISSGSVNRYLNWGRKRLKQILNH